MAVLISEDLIELGLDAASKEEVINRLGRKLLDQDLVHEGYCEHVVEREKHYPTGLPTVIPIAVCHTEAQYVKQSAMAIGVLAHPVDFSEMGTPERNVAAQIVFLLALNDPKQQVPWLQKMMQLFKDRETLEHIQQAQDPKALESYLRSIFNAS
jgi:PTS system galactitol-specific IIA component